MENKTIIIFTLFYPYGDYDYYINDEIKKISNEFNKIIVITIDDNYSIGKKIRNVPSNIIFYRASFKYGLMAKISSTSLIFHKFFIKELKNIFLSRNKLLFLRNLIRESYVSLKYRNKIYELCELNNIDFNHLFIYTYWLTEPTIASVLVKNKFNNVVAISRAHSYDFYNSRSPSGFWPLRKFMSDNLNAIFFVSNFGKNYFINRFKVVDSSNLFTSRLGIQKTSTFKSFENSNVLNLVSIGWIQKLKRIDLLVNSLLKIDDFKVNWHHFGSGYMDDIEYKKVSNLINTKLIKKSNISTFLYGEKPNNFVSTFFENKKIDLFISLSSTEGIPVSIMEAMNFSIPVIATDVGGVSEIVNDINGFLIDSNPTPSQIAEKINTFYKMSELEKNIKRRAAFETWNSNYKSDTNYKDFIEKLLSLKVN